MKLAATSSHLKVCLSSRPGVVFEHAFEQSPGLKLHRLTHNDIQAYVPNKFGDSPLMQRFVAQTTSENLDLAEDIVDKSSSVFLWVRVAVRLLLEIMRDDHILARVD